MDWNEGNFPQNYVHCTPKNMNKINGLNPLTFECNGSILLTHTTFLLIRGYKVTVSICWCINAILMR